MYRNNGSLLFKEIRKLTKFKKLFSTKNPPTKPPTDSKPSIINGIELPPEPTTCCMSGCANCVWVEWADKVSNLLKDVGDSKIHKLILDKISDPNMKSFLSLELRMRSKARKK